MIACSHDRQSVMTGLPRRLARATSLTLLSALLMLGATLSVHSAEAVKPGERRCAMLSVQLEKAVKANRSLVSPRVKQLGAAGRDFCSRGKPAEGVRNYVKALTELGVQPVLDTDHK